MIFLVSVRCSESVNESEEIPGVQPDQDQSDEQIEQSDPCSELIISMKFDIEFYWDNVKHEFSTNTTDAVIDSIVFEEDKFGSVMMNDSSSVGCTIPISELTLARSDVWFLYLVNYYKVPLSLVFEWQFDVLDGNCAYPVGLIEYFKGNKKEAIKKLYQYIYSNASSSK